MQKQNPVIKNYIYYPEPVILKEAEKNKPPFGKTQQLKTDYYKISFINFIER